MYERIKRKLVIKTYIIKKSHKNYENMRHSCEFLASGKFVVVADRASGNCKINRTSSTFFHQKSDIIIPNNLIYTRTRGA